MKNQNLSELVLNKPLIAVYYSPIETNGQINLSEKSSIIRYHMITLICYYIERNGGIPLLINNNANLDSIVDNIDGYLLPGGSDINPSFYNREKHPQTEIKEDEEILRFSLEETFVRNAVKTGKPILAICRGMQTTNVILGRIWREENPNDDIKDKGTLIQHLPDIFPDDDIHKDENVYNVDSKAISSWQEKIDNGLNVAHPLGSSHDIKILTGTKLFEIIGKEQVGCCSCHHQGIGENNLAPQLKANAYSVKQDGSVNYGIIDGAEYKNLLLVQSHPEIGVGNTANALFKNLINDAKEYIDNNHNTRQINVEQIVDYYNKSYLLLSNLKK